MAEIDRLRAKCELYENTLRFYAKPSNWGRPYLPNSNTLGIPRIVLILKDCTHGFEPAKQALEKANGTD